MTKQYLIKREYLGNRVYHYYLRYGGKTVFIVMEWISGVYQITQAKLSAFQESEFMILLDSFPYKKTVGVIDKIEELLKE